MRILITGGFGLIGGRIAQYLASTGHQIILGTRKKCQTPSWLESAQVLKINWEDLASLEKNCNYVDVVIHAAGMNSRDCIADPAAALNFNGVATSRLVNAAIKSGVKKFIYLSTAHIYASPLVDMITENTYPRNLHPYAVSHRAGEDAVRYYDEQGLIDGVVLRLSNIYGKPTHPDANCWMLLVNDLCRQAAEKGVLVLRSQGTDHRDFLPLTNLCHHIDKLLFSNKTQIKSNVINIGAGKSQQLITVAELIKKRCSIVLGYTPNIETQIKKNLPNSNYKKAKQSSFKYTSLYFKEEPSENEKSQEIDSLLIECAKWFKLSK